MESLSAKVRNTTTNKVRLVYVSQKGILAQDERGQDIVFFQFGSEITPYLRLPHEYTERDSEIKGNTEAYCFFNNGFAFWVSHRNNRILQRMRCDASFIFKGYELIGMKFEQFSRLNLLEPDYVEYNHEFPGPNENFRHYTVYYFCKHELVFWVWREKIRMVHVKNLFFNNIGEYVKFHGIKKYKPILKE